MLIYSYYLNNNSDSKEDRLKILQFFLKENCPVSAHTVKNYIVHTSIDTENKLAVIKMIFETNINKTYLGDLLSDYLLSSKDTKDIKDEISEYLINSGFKVNSDFLTQYVVLSEDTVEVKVDKIKKMVANGTQIKADCLDKYILSLQKPSEFSEKMFNLLAEHGFMVSFKAYSRFLLYCKDIDKVRHNKKLLDIVKGELNSQQVNIQHSSNSIVCNLLQAYILLTEDQYDIADSIISDLLTEKIKINTEILAEDNVMKFKKYVGLKKASLSPLSLQICEKYKMFSFF